MEKSSWKVSHYFNEYVVALVILCGMIVLFLAMLPEEPKDYYDRLIDEPCDVTRKGLVGRFEFQNKYPGKHEVGILLGGFTSDQYFKPLSERYALKLRMQITFYAKDSIVLSQVVGSDYSPFVGRMENGFIFFLYDCPGDLPLNELLTCEVRVTEPDKTLGALYGPARLYIKKLSENEM